MKAVDRVTALARSMESDLRENILPFWMRAIPDEVRGGFHGYASEDGTVDPLAPRGGVLLARILWTFASVYLRYGEPEHRALAERALSSLLDRFWDPVHGGVFWTVDHEGRPLSERKQTYHQAFALYGLAEHHRATGSRPALEHAIRLYHVLEEHAADPDRGGYWEARARDWAPLQDVRLSEKDRNTPRSMNTHLHVMEAYTDLLRVWDGEGLPDRLKALVEIHLDRILDPGSTHLALFFDEAWRPVGRVVSFGHDIEASWLLVEAADVLGDPSLRTRAREAAARMARVARDEGLDRQQGGLYAERDEGGELDDEKHWWMQAEAIVGFVGAWELTGDLSFLDAAEEVWRFVDRYVVDRAHGEWRWRVERDGTPIPGLPKVEPWKCPYHNSRAALEVLRRAEALESSRSGPGPSRSGP